MNISNKESAHTSIKREKEKKKKQKTKHSKGEYNGRRNSFKNVHPEEYLKPVKFVSGGFLNNKKKITAENQDLDNLNYTLSDNDSDDFNEYDVFKHFSFDFNFHLKKDENYFIKNNLKKYNLKELKEKDDKFFEKYGLGFKILRKMGYEDGIGNQIKTNIAPIELQKKHITFFEEKSQENSNPSNSDIEIHNTHECSDDIFKESTYSKNLWKKKYNYKKNWNFHKIKNQIHTHLKYNTSFRQNFHLFYYNEKIHDEKLNNLQNVQNFLIEHVKNITADYFNVVKKKQLIENKLRNYQNYGVKKDIYKMHTLILKNVLTYKYLLNLHTALSYPTLFNNATYNEYLFSLKHDRKKIQQGEEQNDHADHADDDDDDDDDGNDGAHDGGHHGDDGYAVLDVHDQSMYNMSEFSTSAGSTKLINTHRKLFINATGERETNENGRQAQCQLKYTNSGTFEEKLNNLLMDNYKLLCENEYFRSAAKVINFSSNKNGTYKKMHNLNDIFNLINIKNIIIEKGRDQLLLSDIYTCLFFIYENSQFLCLSSYVSRFFIEFLRVYFHNNKERIINQLLYDEKDWENVNTENLENIDISKYPDAHSEKRNVLDGQNERVQNVSTKKDEKNSHCEQQASYNPSNKQTKNEFNQNDIQYITCLKKIILMGAEEQSMTEYLKIENEFDSIIYHIYVYPIMYKKNCHNIFKHIELFKDSFNVKYYKNVLIRFIKKKIITKVKNMENNEIEEHTLQDIQNKLLILFDINKQFNINTHICNYYTYSIFPYLQKCNISENFIKLIKLALMENIYKKEIFENIVKRIISELIDINFSNDNFVQHLRKITMLNDFIDDKVTSLIFKVYFFYNFSKHVCDYLRELNALYVEKNEMNNNIHKSEVPLDPEQDMQTQEEKKLILTNKKKYIYETFKNVKDVIENNLMKDNSIKNIMLSILNVIKTYLMQDKIITFPVEKVLDFDKNHICSDDNINHYFLYNDIRIPIPLYAVPQRSTNIFEMNYMHIMRKNQKTDESNNTYTFSPKKYVNLMNKLENDVNQYRRNVQEDEENINVKSYIEKYCIQNDILFIQKNDRKINGNVVYSINNFSIYINNNIIYIYENHEWIPTLLRDLLKKIS
ncbi:hypothetical protein, conserved [Plasmodium gonderi]|uniref:G-patch domain-containing protein n=1 Tax=Plasmodium gonderi TaxID=77519 RepID=A0A1Y1JJ79_PLAGO|nr:hypothetical protein, conserved [Plasmodium gonderi]GAW81247.1 hypothetical protein, conserved [Plasmodium gonderi]